MRWLIPILVLLINIFTTFSKIPKPLISKYRKTLTFQVPLESNCENVMFNQFDKLSKDANEHVSILKRFREDNDDHLYALFAIDTSFASIVIQPSERNQLGKFCEHRWVKYKTYEWCGLPVVSMIGGVPIIVSISKPDDSKKTVDIRLFSFTKASKTCLDKIHGKKITFPINSNKSGTAEDQIYNAFLENNTKFPSPYLHIYKPLDSKYDENLVFNVKTKFQFYSPNHSGYLHKIPAYNLLTLRLFHLLIREKVSLVTFIQEFGLAGFILDSVLKESQAKEIINILRNLSKELSIPITILKTDKFKYDPENLIRSIKLPQKQFINDEIISSDTVPLVVPEQVVTIRESIHSDSLQITPALFLTISKYKKKFSIDPEDYEPVLTSRRYNRRAAKKAEKANQKQEKEKKRVEREQERVINAHKKEEKAKQREQQQAQRKEQQKEQQKELEQEEQSIEKETPQPKIRKHIIGTGDSNKQQISESIKVNPLSPPVMRKPQTFPRRSVIRPKETKTGQHPAVEIPARVRLSGGYSSLVPIEATAETLARKYDSDYKSQFI